jgi:hypothetical protein
VPVVPEPTTVCILKFLEEFLGIVNEITPVLLFVTPPINLKAPVDPVVGALDNIELVKSVPVPSLTYVRPEGRVSLISSIVISEVVELLAIVMVKVMESPGE